MAYETKNQMLSGHKQIPYSVSFDHIKKQLYSFDSADTASAVVINSVTYNYQETTVTITAADAATVCTVNGTGYNANAGVGTATETEIATELAAAITAGETAVSAAVVGATCVISQLSSYATFTAVGTTNCSVAHSAKTEAELAAGLAAVVEANVAIIDASVSTNYLVIAQADSGASFAVEDGANTTFYNGQVEVTISMQDVQGLDVDNFFRSYIWVSTSAGGTLATTVNDLGYDGTYAVLLEELTANHSAIVKLKDQAVITINESDSTLTYYLNFDVPNGPIFSSSALLITKA